MRKRSSICCIVSSDTRPRRRLSLFLDVDRTFSHWINKAVRHEATFGRFNVDMPAYSSFRPRNRDDNHELQEIVHSEL